MTSCCLSGECVTLAQRGTLHFLSSTGKGVYIYVHYSHSAKYTNL